MVKTVLKSAGGCANMTIMINLSQETEALARRLAVAQNTSVDAAVRRALEAQADAVGIPPELRPPRDQSAEAIARRRAHIARIVSEIVSMRILDRRSPQEIMDALNEI
jgi:antitoxin VapB